jgi:hypothetical protein
MEDYIAGLGTDSTDITVFKKSTGKHNRRVGAHVPVSWQGELLRHKIDAVFDLAEVRCRRQGFGNTS